MNHPLKVVELDHVVLRCRDQTRMLAFYTGVLGLPEERRIASIGLVQLRAGRSMIDLVPGRADQTTGADDQTTGANVDHICLGVEISDVDGMIKYLQAMRVEVIGAPAERYGARGMGTSVYVRDPEGNVVELKQFPPGLLPDA